MKAKNDLQVNELKDFKLIFSQQSTKVEINFSIDSTKENNDSLLIGSAINELFTMQNNYKEAGLTLFKATYPTLFRIEGEEGVILDVAKCTKIIENKLKFGNTGKSRRAFAKRINVAVKEIRRQFVLIDYNELTEKLNAID